VITAINGNTITLDAALPDSIDSVYLGTGVAAVQAFTFTSRITNAGVENFRVIAPVPATDLMPPTASYQLVVTYALMNGWVRNLTAQDPLEAIDIEPWGKQITVSDISLTHTVTQAGSAKFEDYFINQATQVVMDTVTDATNSMIYFATRGETEGPFVLRNANFSGNGDVDPHQRWASGLLIENTTVSALDGGTAGEINLWDRGNYGTGQGWTMGDGVVWNSTAGSFIIQQPPGSQNWCIGCIGTQTVSAAPPSTGSVLPEGEIESPGTYVSPASLYESQLMQRLGSVGVPQ
jgi:hypothetical protein